MYAQAHVVMLAKNVVILPLLLGLILCRTVFLRSFNVLVCVDSINFFIVYVITLCPKKRKPPNFGQ